MRRLYLVLALSLGGCCAPNAAFVNYLEKTWGTIGPEYQAYIDADPSLTPETKVTRKRTADGLSATIAEARKAVRQ